MNFSFIVPYKNIHSRLNLQQDCKFLQIFISLQFFNTCDLAKGDLWNPLNLKKLFLHLEKAFFVIAPIRD